jgi:hypothetical protein
MTRNILNNSGGLSEKCRNLHSISRPSLVMKSPKAGAAIILLVLQYDCREGF